MASHNTNADLNNNGATPRRSSSSATRRGKSVRFAAPIVTLVKYRPYTEESEIPVLYFQEEELDELEWDREMDPGDAFECSLDDIGDDELGLLSVSVDHCVVAADE